MEGLKKVKIEILVWLGFFCILVIAAKLSLLFVLTRVNEAEQRRILVIEQPGTQLRAGPAALSSSLPQTPPSPWLLSFGSWPQTAVWKHTGGENVNRKYTTKQ